MELKSKDKGEEHEEEFQQKTHKTACHQCFTNKRPQEEKREDEEEADEEEEDEEKEDEEEKKKTREARQKKERKKKYLGATHPKTTRVVWLKKSIQKPLGLTSSLIINEKTLGGWVGFS